LAGEVDVGQVWRGTWGISGQYDFVRAEFDEGGNVPRIPPHRLGGGLFYRDAALLARVGLLHAFEQDKVAENEDPTKGYNLLSAEISYTTTLPYADGVAPEITIGLIGENLLDDDVRNHVSFKKDDVLLPGQTIKLQAKVKLN
jgi:iron complex outermembrane receptor protein